MELSALSSLIDAFGAARDERLAADKVAEKLKEKEGLLKEVIIQELRASESSGSSGKAFGVNLKKKDKIVSNDWLAFYAYIKEHDAFDLLHKRITESAVQLRLDDGQTVPGIELFPVYDLTISRK